MSTHAISRPPAPYNEPISDFSPGSAARESLQKRLQQMRSERATMLRRAYLADVLKQNPPVLNELALSSLLENSSK